MPRLVTTLRELEIKKSDIELFVTDAMRQWTGTFNPVPLDEPTVRYLYEQVLGE